MFFVVLIRLSLSLIPLALVAWKFELRRFSLPLSLAAFLVPQPPRSRLHSARRRRPFPTPNNAARLRIAPARPRPQLLPRPARRRRRVPLRPRTPPAAREPRSRRWGNASPRASPHARTDQRPRVRHGREAGKAATKGPPRDGLDRRAHATAPPGTLVRLAVPQQLAQPEKSHAPPAEGELWRWRRELAVDWHGYTGE